MACCGGRGSSRRGRSRVLRNKKKKQAIKQVVEKQKTKTDDAG